MPDEAKKLKFLDSISTLSNLPAFMDKALLVEKIKELIDHESVDSLTGVMRQQAMLAIMKLSKMKLPLLVLTQPSLLTTCFSSIFSLPPAHTMEEVEAALYTKTLKTMDEMLKALVCEDQEPNLLVLQIILKVLLPWTTSREVHERLRAVGRIRWLMEFLGSQCKFQEVEEFRVLGQLVGCLTLCCVEQEQEIWQSAVEGLHHLFSFMQLLKSKMLVKHGAEYRQILKDSQTERAFWVTNISNITSAMLLLMQPNIPAYMTHRKMHWGSSKPDPSSLSGLLGASSEINAIKGIIASAYEHQPLLSTRECIRAAQYCAPVHCHAGLCHA
ncbi:maestro heat-like repeat family member 5 isoform X4 [Mauremys reevesii]|uniref:maestro heat-like repeat family member 5 isoform X4 n=1 Tax=Mauremys reevesii TaxID=260615 RepID=UPI00193F98DF|nr:maestro heat-like repeat family member 5 isoform X4 [Mauremys reevesii]